MPVQVVDNCNPVLGDTANKALKRVVEALDNTRGLSAGAKQWYWTVQKAILKLLCRLRLTHDDLTALNSVMESFTTGQYGQSLSVDERRGVVYLIGCAIADCQQSSSSAVPVNQGVRMPTGTLLPSGWTCANPALGERLCQLIKAKIIRHNEDPAAYSTDLGKAYFRGHCKLLLGMPYSSAEGQILQLSFVVEHSSGGA